MVAAGFSLQVKRNPKTSVFVIPAEAGIQKLNTQKILWIPHLDASLC
jgi:hypothetical protein